MKFNVKYLDKKNDKMKEEVVEAKSKAEAILLIQRKMDAKIEEVIPLKE